MAKTDHGQYDHPGELPYVTGTALLVKRAVLEKIGLMDEDYFCYFDDFDWGLKARKAGYRLLLGARGRCPPQGVANGRFQ